ncbi:hypothetical protein [Microbacterium sp. LMI1-1-1.1]|uniref:hypothetical protein n=1 Tax=Microbacterium sp. LMI1-1-1.1 TaxID=3135223 RepID=UPI003465C08F
MVTSAADVPDLPIDPQALTAEVERLRSGAAAVHAASTDVSSAWNGLPATVESPQTTELLSQMQTVHEAMTATVEMSVQVADILDQVAEQMLRLKQQRDQLAGEVEAHQRMVAALDIDEASPGAGTDLQEQSRHLRRQIDAVIEEARSDLARLGVPPWAVARFGDRAVTVGPPVPFATRAAAFNDDTTLIYLAALAAGDARHVEDLLRRHPEWRDLLENKPPSAEAVRQWWDTLDDRARAALVAGAPELVGALGGVPPLDRVAANRRNAQRRRAEAAAELARLDAPGEFERDAANLGPDAAETVRVDRRAAVDRLRAEIAYLDRVDKGEVQLFLFRPEDDEIVEMIGTPGPDTARVLTYVPGTFTTRHSFYRNEVQQVAGWMVERGAVDVAFVWKGTEFPGDDENSGMTGQAAGILEANGQERAAPAASDLAGFRTELDSDASLKAASQIGMGHSWGLVPLTGSEAAGVHYDQVHSLAGAWVPPDWTASGGTDYFHWSYVDALSMAQDVLPVGEGRNPDTSQSFESHVFARQGDFRASLDDPNVLDPVGIPATIHPLFNHNLIAQDSPSNLPALNEMRRRILDD